MSDYRKAESGYMVHRSDSNRYEHRDVWAAANGPIPRDHQVHHKNKVRDDNRLENLECMSRSAHMRFHGFSPEMVKHINAVRRHSRRRKFNCVLCGVEKETFHRTQKFCCTAHAHKHQNNLLAARRTKARAEARGSGECPECKKTFVRGRPEQKFCGKLCKTRMNGRNWHRVRHPEWKRRVAA